MGTEGEGTPKHWWEDGRCRTGVGRSQKEEWDVTDRGFRGVGTPTESVVRPESQDPGRRGCREGTRRGRESTVWCEVVVVARDEDFRTQGVVRGPVWGWGLSPAGHGPRTVESGGRGEWKRLKGRVGRDGTVQGDLPRATRSGVERVTVRVDRPGVGPFRDSEDMCLDPPSRPPAFEGRLRLVGTVWTAVWWCGWTREGHRTSDPSLGGLGRGRVVRQSRWLRVQKRLS